MAVYPAFAKESLHITNTVVVFSKDVPQPAAVRYGWSQQFNWANLFNKDGLPATPFRTDDW